MGLTGRGNYLINRITILRKINKTTRLGHYPLFFTDCEKTIRWRGGLIKLGNKKYMLAKTIWRNKKHGASIVKIEEKVWGIDETESFIASCVSIDTIKNTISQLSKQLQEVNFPYELRVLKNGKEIAGVKLKLKQQKTMITLKQI